MPQGARLRRICVFCGSRPGSRSSFSAAATALGTTLAQRDIELVYGGASVGIMGVLADAVLAAGGRVTGVITESLADHEIAHRRVTRLDVVATMHARKHRMAELSDAFIMLPGGFGTFEEFMEAVTWRQLGIHTKASGILNVDGFFDDLLAFTRHAVDSGFITAHNAAQIVVADHPDALLDRLGAAEDISG